MKHKKILLFLALSIFICRVAFSQPKDILKGIDKVFVSVKPIDKDALDMGLTWERLKTVTELRLRKEGIIVNPQFDHSNRIEYLTKQLSTPTIYVDVYVLAARTEGEVIGYVFSVNLKILEAVILRRDKNITCPATIWSSSILGTHRDDPEYIVSGLSGLLDQFLNDYYKANPKKEVGVNHGSL